MDFTCHPLRLRPILTLFGRDRQEISEETCIKIKSEKKKKKRYTVNINDKLKKI